jgi:hypothetical protein
MNPAASIRPSATHREQSLPPVRDAAQSSHDATVPPSRDRKPLARKCPPITGWPHAEASSPRTALMCLNFARSVPQRCRCARVKEIGELSAERETRRRQWLSAFASERVSERGTGRASCRPG